MPDLHGIGLLKAWAGNLIFIQQFVSLRAEPVLAETARSQGSARNYAEETHGSLRVFSQSWEVSAGQLASAGYLLSIVLARQGAGFQRP